MMRRSMAAMSTLTKKARLSSASARPMSTSVSWVRDGIEYRALERSFDPETLFAFNKEHGSSPLNFIPDEPVRKHFSKLATGETVVWGAFQDTELVGMITGELGGGYWLQTGAGEEATCFINEFVVNPTFRGRRIGVNLTSMSVDPKVGIFGINPNVKEMYTTVHVDNVTSRTAFVKGGYNEVITYADAHRSRNTTVLKFAGAGQSAAVRRGNSQTMRVIGIQSGNGAPAPQHITHCTPPLTIPPLTVPPLAMTPLPTTPSSMSPYPNTPYPYLPPPTHLPSPHPDRTPPQPHSRHIVSRPTQAQPTQPQPRSAVFCFSRSNLGSPNPI